MDRQLWREQHRGLIVFLWVAGFFVPILGVVIVVDLLWGVQVLRDLALAAGIGQMVFFGCYAISTIVDRRRN